MEDDYREKKRDWLITRLYVFETEDSVNRLIDLQTKWNPVILNLKSRKWILKDRMKNGDPDTKQEALAIFLHLYNEEDILE